MRANGSNVGQHTIQLLPVGNVNRAGSGKGVPDGQLCVYDLWRPGDSKTNVGTRSVMGGIKENNRGDARARALVSPTGSSIRGDNRFKFLIDLRGTG